MENKEKIANDKKIKQKIFNNHMLEKIKNFDFPIINTGPITNVGKDTSNYIVAHKKYFLLTLLISILIEIIIYFIGVTDIAIYLFIFFIPIGLFYGYVRYKIQNKLFEEIIKKYNLQYFKEGEIQGSDSVIFKFGNHSSAKNIASGTFLDNSINFFEYNIIGDYSNREQKNALTCFMMEFHGMVPWIILESVSKSLPVSLASFDFKKITLEGDFNNYFSLNIKKEYEIEALQILTPDIMEYLINKAQGLNIEITNNHFFIYRTGVISSLSEIENFFSVASFFVKKLIPVLEKIKVNNL